MIDKSIKKALTDGLLAGYAGKTSFQGIDRGGFELKESHYTANALLYHDEWLPNRNGGGQELVKIDAHQYTRLYAGGLVDESSLQKLGIDEQDVISALISLVKINAEKTRLDQDCRSVYENHYTYTYTVQKREPLIGLFFAKEEILYKNSVVFIHYFLFSPII